MAVNCDKPDRWKADIVRSVDLYNSWFLEFAPKAFRDTRITTTKSVEEALQWTDFLRSISAGLLSAHPTVLPMLRMSTCPPIARDRLIGLSKVSPSLVRCMELEGRVPPKMRPPVLEEELRKIVSTINALVDPDIFVWLGRATPPDQAEIHRAATIVADRLCGSVADPIVRNAQEKRQLALIEQWLQARGYRQLKQGEAKAMIDAPAGTFAFRYNVPVVHDEDGGKVNIPIDILISLKSRAAGELPLLIEAKSAGDFTNVNKRRKEEATKINQLRKTYGEKIRFALFLCGYFDSGYLGYEAAEGIDWVWEHRIDDLAQFGL